MAKEGKKLSVDISNAKSEQSELKKPEIKKKSLLSRIEAKPSHPLDSSNWQKKKLQRLSAQELKQRNMAWVPKGSIQTQDNDDGPAKGAMQLKKNRKPKRRYSNMRFTPNNQNYWSVHHPFDLPMSYTPMSWNSSYNMFGVTA